MINNSFWENRFCFKRRNTNFKQECIAGLTTFLAMVYSVIAVPTMLADAGFSPESVFIATCLVSGIGSILMGLWANTPMAIGCAISLTAFTAYTLVLNNHLPIPAVLGAVFYMGLIFTLISVTGIRNWILKNIPLGVAHGTGIGIGLFLLLIATKNVGFIVSNPHGVLIKLGDFSSFPVLISFLGLCAIIGLEQLKIKGSILIVIIAITILGFIFDANVSYQGLIAIPNLTTGQQIFNFDLIGVLNITFLPIIFALVITAVFDATGTIRAVAGQADLIDEDGQIINGGKALTVDSVSSILAGCLGTAPAAVYIESAAGTAAGGRTGLTAVVTGVLFLIILFFQPLATLVPGYATAPALMYVGLLMLSNVNKLNFDDLVDAASGLICGVFILLSANVVTGIMLGFVAVVIGRVIAGEWRKLNIGTVTIAVALFAFYYFNLAL